ncbi:MAG: glycosyltransferase family A protein [Nitrospirales bacterium]|nr:glycosyltransferase family A protein [Nitrospirales bacterium]
MDEILVWNNDPAIPLTLPGTKTRVIASLENLGCYGRFACAQQARNEVIFTQDDDVLVLNVPDLYRHFLADPTRITHALDKEHFLNRRRHLHGNCHAALLGWGSFFMKDWIGVFDDLPEEIRKSPLFHREADKFFTLLQEKHHHTIPGQLRHLEGRDTPGVALWQDPQHRVFKALAVREALRAVRLRKNPAALVPWNIVVPTYNYAQYLPDTVRSILQNDADYTLTIVDDASTDETPEVALELLREYPHLTYLRLDENRGMPGAVRNHGIKAHDSLFVMAVDADDKIGRNYLYEAQRMLEDGADVANPDAILFGNRNERWCVPEKVTLPMLLQRNFVHTAAGFRRTHWTKVGGYDETMRAWQDYELWIRLAAAGARIRRIEGNHFYYRRHGHSITSEARIIKSQLRSYIQKKHCSLYQQHKVPVS